MKMSTEVLDRREYVRCVLGGRPYRYSFTLAEGRIRVSLSELNTCKLSLKRYLATGAAPETGLFAYIDEYIEDLPSGDNFSYQGQSAEKLNYENFLLNTNPLMRTELWKKIKEFETFIQDDYSKYVEAGSWVYYATEAAVNKYLDYSSVTINDPSSIQMERLVHKYLSERDREKLDIEERKNYNTEEVASILRIMASGAADSCIPSSADSGPVSLPDNLIDFLKGGMNG